MAIKVGKESVESAFKLYKGVAALNIVAVNPNRKELSAILNRDIEEEPEYVTKNENGKPQVRLTFYARTAPDAKINNGIDIPISFSFNLIADKRVSTAKGTIQVIDKYGRTAWASPEEIAKNDIPVYSNGPANISKGYREACIGEELLIDFLTKWLNIPNPADYNRETKQWIMKKDPSDSEVDLNLKALFRGDFTELKELVEIAKNHLVKAAIGIRTTDEGKQYQSVFTRYFERNAVTNYSKLDATIADFQASGSASNVLYSNLPLHENVIEATEYKETVETSSDLPTGSSPWDD